jgi:hypothetical protein
VAGVGFSAVSAELVKTRPCGIERPGVVGVAGSWAALGGSSPFLIRISNTSSTIWLFTFFGRELVLLLPELFVSASCNTKKDFKFKTSGLWMSIPETIRTVRHTFLLSNRRAGRGH